MTDIEAILTEVRALIAKREALWRLADVAEYLQLSPDHVRKHVTVKRGFPRPVELPGAGKHGDLRWLPDEVKTWAKLQRAR